LKIPRSLYMLIAAISEKNNCEMYPMEKKTRAKLIIAIFLITAISLALYFRWRPNALGLDLGWGKGNLIISEKAYYFEGINRIIESWQQTKRNAEREKDGRLKDSYKIYLVIDLDKKSFWMEENGQVRAENYIELPPKTKWTLHYFTPTSDTVLTGRTILKIRGYNTRQITPEKFFLVGKGAEGYIHFQFDSNSRGGGSGSGSFNKPSISLKSSSANKDELYGSIIVTQDEYQQYRDSLADSNVIQSGEENTQAEFISGLEENKAAWSRIEKHLYMEIDKQVRQAGYELYRLTVEPGPDFSAGHAELRARSSGLIKQFFGGSRPVESYLQIDNIGNDIWYAKSAANPRRPMLSRRQFDLEFLIYPQSSVSESQYQELIEQSRLKHQPASVPESKWKAELPNGDEVEFIGVCENPSAGKQWWGPDGSPLDFVPYANTKTYGRPRDDRKIYEFAWRINRPGGGGAIRHSFDGSKGSYYRQLVDIYGNRIAGNLNVEGQAFDKSCQMTTWKVGLSQGDWQTVLVVEDKAGEINFLDKQRIILNPPVVEAGQIVVRCYDDYRSRMREYNTDFGLIVYEDSTVKTVSLGRYREETKDDRDTGLTEHIYTLKDLSMSQIEGVCFRYCPYKFVTFKNISLVPGKDMGFKIELDGQ
jgi:hypothetical protein